MRKIRIIEQISLDGVIQAPGGRDEIRRDPQAGQPRMGPVEDLGADMAGEVSPYR